MEDLLLEYTLDEGLTILCIWDHGRMAEQLDRGVLACDRCGREIGIGEVRRAVLRLSERARGLAERLAAEGAAG